MASVLREGGPQPADHGPDLVGLRGQQLSLPDASQIPYAILKNCGPLAQLVRAEDLMGDFLTLGASRGRERSDGLLKVSSLCLDVELLKFGERYGAARAMPTPSETPARENV
jgi:hypothetical protein